MIHEHASGLQVVYKAAPPLPFRDLDQRPSNFSVFNESDVGTPTVLRAAVDQHPDLAPLRDALVTWNSGPPQNGAYGRAGNLLDRDLYVNTTNVFDEMRVATKAAEDDIVAAFLDSSEALAFSRMEVECDDEDEMDIWAQIMDDIDLDSRMREIWRDLNIYSQCYVAVWFGRKSYRVRGKNDRSGVRRKKAFADLTVPLGVTTLDPMKVVPVGNFLFQQETLTYYANPTEKDVIDSWLLGDDDSGADEIIKRLIIAKYEPDYRDRKEIGNLGVDPNRLYVLNPKYCLPDGAHVWTTDGPVPVENVQVGQSVWSKDGNKLVQRSITDKWEVGTRPLVSVKTNRGELKVTPDHPVQVVRRGSGKGRGAFLPTLAWQDAGSLQKGDVIVTLAEFGGEGDSPSTEQAFALGLLMGDGARNPRLAPKTLGPPTRTGRHLTGSSHFVLFPATHQTDRWVAAISEALPGVTTHVRNYGSGCDVLDFAHDDLVPWAPFMRDRSTERLIPRWIWTAPEAIRLSFLNGFLEADGHLRHRGTNGGCTEWTWKLANHELVRQVRVLAASVGWKVTSVKEGRNRLRGFEYPYWYSSAYPVGRHNRLPQSHTGRPETAERAADLLLGDNFCSATVSSVEEQGSARVWDITVEDTHNFVAEGFVVHNCWRHTTTKAGYDRFAPLRFKSIFELLDLKRQLRQMDRAHLIGATNYILLIKKGSDKEPAKQYEIANLQQTARSLSKVPILVGDHRLSIEIITPKLDSVLDETKYQLIDLRLAGRLFGMFLSTHAGRDDSLKLARVVARGLESRRLMQKRAFMRKVIMPTYEMNESLTAEPDLLFYPKRIALDFDPSLATYLLDLRDRGDLSRDSVLAEIDYDEASEAAKRKVEKAKYDETFTAPASQLPPGTPGIPGVPKPPPVQAVPASPGTQSTKPKPVPGGPSDPKRAGRALGGNRGKGGNGNIGRGAGQPAKPAPKPAQRTPVKPGGGGAAGEAIRSRPKLDDQLDDDGSE